MVKCWLEPFCFPLPTLLLYLPSRQEQDPPWTRCCFMLLEKVFFSFHCCLMLHIQGQFWSIKHIMYFIPKPLLVMFQDNFLDADTSHLHCWCDFDPFSTTAGDPLEDFYEFLWTLILNPFHMFSTGVKSGDWPCQLYFLSLKPTELCVLLKCSPFTVNILLSGSWFLCLSTFSPFIVP